MFSHFNKARRKIISRLEPGGGLSSPPPSPPPAIIEGEQAVRNVTTHLFAFLVAVTISAVAIGAAVTV